MAMTRTFEGITYTVRDVVVPIKANSIKHVEVVVAFEWAECVRLARLENYLYTERTISVKEFTRDYKKFRA